MPETRGEVDGAACVPHVRTCGMLRRLASRARAAAFQRHGAPDDFVAGARRHLGLVLCSPALLRSDARPAAATTLRTIGALQASCPPMTAAHVESFCHGRVG